jgi:hypothetical protein
MAANSNPDLSLNISTVVEMLFPAKEIDCSAGYIGEPPDQLVGEPYALWCSVHASAVKNGIVAALAELDEKDSRELQKVYHHYALCFDAADFRRTVGIYLVSLIKWGSYDDLAKDLSNISIEGESTWAGPYVWTDTEVLLAGVVLLLAMPSDVVRDRLLLNLYLDNFMVLFHNRPNLSALWQAADAAVKANSLGKR